MLGNVYRSMLPYRLQYFSHCKYVFQNGTGLEIGGPSKIFGPQGSIPVYPLAINIDNCNFSRDTVWEGAIREGNNFIFDEGRVPGRQYVVEAGNLQGIEDASYDFVLSSHCIEHLANPLQGLAEWTRVLKNNGLLVLVVPHKDGTFDHRRPVTSLEHMVHDFDIQTGEDDMTHLEEILSLHDRSIDSGAGNFQIFPDRSMRNFENRCLHHHVFDTHLAVAMVDHMGLQLLAVEVLRPMHIVLIARKLGVGQTPHNEKFNGVGGTRCWRSPFPSDRRTPSRRRSNRQGHAYS
jgi:SAM-dependent methyltransferase